MADNQALRIEVHALISGHTYTLESQIVATYTYGYKYFHMYPTATAPIPAFPPTASHHPRDYPHCIYHFTFIVVDRRSGIERDV